MSMSKNPRSDWDAPVDGDFASYVERLNQTSTSTLEQSQAQVQAQSQERASAVWPSEAQPPKTAPALASPRDPSDLTPEEAKSSTDLAHKMRFVRLVFLLVFVGHVLMLFFYHKGSLFLLFFNGVLWLLLGNAQSALFSASPNAHGGDSLHLQRLRKQLVQSIRERATKQKNKK